MLQTRPHCELSQVATAFADDGQAVHEAPQLFGLVSLRHAVPHR